MPNHCALQVNGYNESQVHNMGVFFITVIIENV